MTGVQTCALPILLGTNEEPGPWYPMWSFSNNFTTDTEGGMAWTKIGEVKHEQLPQVVMAKDFDKAWATYMMHTMHAIRTLSLASYRQSLISELQTQQNTNNT